MDSGNNTIRDWLTRAVAALEANASVLNELDRQVGDADHGTNLLRGFRAAQDALVDDDSPAENVKHLGMALVTHVGGASGPLYGTFFLRAGQIWQSQLTTDSLARACRLGLDGVMARGKAAIGDATMVDALAPAVESLELSAATGTDVAEASALAAKASDEGAKATVDMVARRGRASYLGERSIGHLDPGAVSSALLFSTLLVPQG